MDLRFVASVAERDIDFLLLEELSVNNEFCDWFTSRLYGKPIFRERVDVLHSVSHAQLGESDLIFQFLSDDGGNMAILIENKIDARAQPLQGDRYRLRGELGKGTEDWNDFSTCVVAPARYLSAGNRTDAYDYQLSYEEILSFFISRRSRAPRYVFKARLVREAIEQNRRGHQAEISEEMTQFVQAYCEYAARISPASGVQAAKPRPAGNTWVMFNPAGFPKRITLAHQLTAGYAKLFIADAAAEAEKHKAEIGPTLPGNVEFGVSGKSVTLSVEVPKLHPIEHTFAQEEEHAKVGIQAIGELIALYRRVAKPA
jgi:hypothetical protein